MNDIEPSTKEAYKLHLENSYFLLQFNIADFLLRA